MKMKEVGNAFGRKSLLLLLIVVTGSCWAQNSSLDNYAEAWQKVLESQTWKDALKTEIAHTASEAQNFYASNEEVVLEVDDERKKIRANSIFDSKYDALVRRAYLKIIAEAEKADARLEKEFILRNAAALKKGKKKSKEFDKKLELVNERYNAHREMLEGLKSWNISSEYGTDDLKFFKAENKIAVQEMIQKGKRESAVIKYLIYKLADLYHLKG